MEQRLSRNGHCAVLNCAEAIRARGLCNAHYQRNRTHGDPLIAISREDRAKHGHSRVGRLSPEYRTWVSMLSRCTNPNRKCFRFYGGQGVSVCKRWFQFENFLADMGERPAGKTLDRYPNKTGNYEPGNCRWATPEQQGNNTTRNVWLELDGRRQTISQWSRELGIKAATLRDRVHRYNWPTHLALTAPINSKLKSARKSDLFYEMKGKP